MGKTMTPSKMTDGQIGRILELLGAKLRKHQESLPCHLVQVALGQPAFSQKLLQAVADQVAETQRYMKVRIVSVKPGRSRQEAINALRVDTRHTDIDAHILSTMPESPGGEVLVYFFYLFGAASNEGLEQEYANRGLFPVDPVTLAASHEECFGFPDDHYSIKTVWREVDGRMSWATFYRLDDPNSVWHRSPHIAIHSSHQGVWGDGWYAGVSIDRS